MCQIVRWGGGASPSSPLLGLWGSEWVKPCCLPRMLFPVLSFCPRLPHSRARLERLMELLMLWRQSRNFFKCWGQTDVCVYIMIIGAKQSFLFIIYIRRHFSCTRTAFDPWLSDLTECLNFRSVYWEMQCLDLRGIS